MLYPIRPLTLSLLLLLHAIVSFAKPEVNISKTPVWAIQRNPDFSKEPQSKDVSGAYLMLYDEQINTAEKTRFKHIVKKIINESGVQSSSEMTFPFIEAYQKLIFHDIFIVRNGQKINKLNISQIKMVNEESSLASHQLIGQYQAVVILDDLRKGDILHIAYSVAGENPIYNGKFADRFAFASAEPITNHYTSLIMPSGKTVKCKGYNNAPEPAIIRRGAYTIYDWPVMQLEAYEFTDNTPRWYIGYPYTEVSEYNNWQEVATWALGVMNNYNYSLTPALRQKIDEWSSGEQFVSNMAEKATRFVQDEIRYMGIEIGINSHKPHSPAETFAKRYGDCKDKSILLTSILRSKNIPAHLALVSTSLGEHLDEHLPSPELFDHVIVKATIEGHDIFIDPTISMQRGNIYYNQIPNYGQTLIVSANTKNPEQIPEPDHGQIEITETYTIPNNNKSTAKLNVLSNYQRASADNIRSFYNNFKRKDIEDYYEDYYRKNYSDIAINDIHYDDDSVSSIIIVRESYTINNVWQEEKGGQYFHVTARPVFDRLATPNDRSSDKPLAQAYPTDIHYSAMLEMPSNWRFPDDGLDILRPSYSFKFKPEVRGNIVILEYQFKTFRDHIPANEVAQYREDYKKMLSRLDYNMNYNKELVNKIDTLNEKGVHGNINWIAVFMCLVCSVGMFFLMRYSNTRSTYLTSHEDSPAQMNWWIIVLGIVIGIRIAIYLYSLATDGYFLTTSWIVMNELGATGMQLMLMLEMVAKAGFLIYACWLMYWHVNKRDIFPRMFTIFALAEFGFNILNYFFAVSNAEQFATIYPSYDDDTQKATMRSLIFVAIWVTAIQCSYVVKAVFIRPFRYITSDEQIQPTDIMNVDIPSEALTLKEHDDHSTTLEKH